MTLDSDHRRAISGDSDGTGIKPRFQSTVAGNSAARVHSAADTSSYSSKCVTAGQVRRERVGSITFASVAETEQQGRWRFCLLQPKPGFTAALCVEQAAGGLRQADSCWQAPLLSMWQTVPQLQERVVPSTACLLATS